MEPSANQSAAYKARDLAARLAGFGLSGNVKVGARAEVKVLSNQQLDERIRRLMEDISARQPELADALEAAVWLRYGIDL